MAEEQQAVPQGAQAELERLREEFAQLSSAYKKQGRTLALAQQQIERNKTAAAAKDSLSRVISAKRSELERYMNLLLGNCPDIILLFDESGRIVYCTESFLKLCRVQAFGLLAGKTVMELLSPYASPAFLEHLERVLARIYAEKHTADFSDAVDFSRTGDTRNYTIQITPMLAESGTQAGLMVIFTDTTEILRAQRAAEQANAAKSDFLATVSHEIRTPMNAIIGVSEMLKSTGLTAQQRDYLSSIQSSSHTLLNLINDILDFSKIEAGKLELLPEYFRLWGLLEHLRALFALMFKQKGLAFSCEFAADLPQVVFGDEKRIRQVLTNILNNALKYTKTGGVWFRVLPAGDGKVRFEVQDTGVGILEEAVPRIFNAFEQLDEVRNKGVIGTGLGLAITKRLCDMMDGEITVQSVFGEGSCFAVLLPLPAGSEGDLPSEGTKDCLDFEAPDARVLVVDDIDINLQVALFMLEQFGIRAETATSGKQAVELAGSTRYDLILMDHMMPEMDGVEATKAIRAMGKKSAAVPVVALTANAVSGAMQMFLENGFNGFLSKPMDEASLASCLLTWLPEDKIVRRNA